MDEYEHGGGGTEGGPQEQRQVAEGRSGERLREAIEGATTSSWRESRCSMKCLRGGELTRIEKM